MGKVSDRKIHRDKVKYTQRQARRQTERNVCTINYWLQPIVTRIPSYVQNTTHVLQVLQDWNLHYGPFDDNTLFVTLDVVEP